VNELTDLPAVAAISAVAAATPITTIAAAPSATATAPTTTAMSATTASEATASPTTAAALLLRTSFVDHQIASTKVLAVQRINRAIGFFIVGNFDESKTT
jgi:hypothetical protein